MPVRAPDLLVALARLAYRIVRVPFQLIEAVGVRRLEPTAPVRMAYERILTDCDETVAHIVHDDRSAASARALRTESAPARIGVALERRRAQQQWVDTARAEVQYLRGRRETLRSRHDRR